MRFVVSALSCDALLLRLVDGRSVFDPSCEVDIRTVEERMREALRLDPPARAATALALLISLESLSDSKVQQLRVDEAVLRSAELDAGTATTVSTEGALARLPSCDEPPYPAP